MTYFEITKKYNNFAKYNSWSQDFYVNDIGDKKKNQDATTQLSESDALRIFETLQESLEEHARICLTKIFFNEEEGDFAEETIVKTWAGELVKSAY